MQQDPRYRSSIEKDGAGDPVSNAWYHQPDGLEGFAKPDPAPPVQSPTLQI